MPYKDPERQREAQRRSYLKHKEVRMAKQKANRKAAAAANRRTKQTKRLRVAKIKEASPCADCEVNYPAAVMEFDHVRGEKIGNVATMVSNGRPWDQIQKEINKCDLVCANCHRLRHLRI